MSVRSDTEGRTLYSISPKRIQTKLIIMAIGERDRRTSYDDFSDDERWEVRESMGFLERDGEI